MHNAKCTMHTSTMHNAQCTMHNAHEHNARCTMHNEQRRSYPDARRARLHSGLLLEALP